MKNKNFRFLVTLVFITSILMSCMGSPEINKKIVKNWWDTAVFYQIWPRSFQDSNGDGIGDFKGMTSRLDYLADLGITAIWLTPMFEAPSYHGYDFQEFYEVESDYGTMEDFEEFLSEAEKRGIKVIADLVLNHISNQSEWFIQSSASVNGDNDPNNDNEYKDYFIWRDSIPTNDNEAVGFEAWGKPWATPENPESGYNKPEWVWVYNETRGQYYYAAFDGSQPDINLQSEAVLAEIKQMSQFWIDKGFDGFRLDAIRYAIETGGYPNQADTNETIDFWVDYNKFIKSYNPNIMLVGEVWAPIDIISKYYSNGKGIDTCFDFEYGSQIMNALNSKADSDDSFGNSTELLEGITLSQALSDNFNKKVEGVAPVGFYSPFNTNHDQDRIMYNFSNDSRKMEIAAVLLMTTIGTPYIYYGEEIGMTQNQTGDDIFKRAPMQWNSSRFAGFTTGDSVWVDDGKWVPWRQNHSPWWQEYLSKIKGNSTVEDQLNDKDSLLNLYKTLIRIRKENPEFSEKNNNSMELLELDKGVAAYRRLSTSGDSSIVIVNESVESDISIESNILKNKTYINLISNEQYTNDGSLNIKAGGYLILKESN